MNLLLLFMSLIFYAFGEPRYILLLIVSVIISYCAGRGIESAKGRNTRRLWLIAAIILHLGLLGYFKYDMFLVGIIDGIAGRELLAFRQIALPIGISFYTFQALSYVFDVYRGVSRPQHSFYKLLLYISFFPQLIAGPIVRYHDISAQIDKRDVNFDHFIQGVNRFVTGLGKKVILSNTFAVSVDRVFALTAAERGMAVSWYGIILYALQIYFDFSGYSDMAIGLGKMFGFDFLENFDLPYISASLREFWRRWHISLSSWFKEYLYIPLGGSRKGEFRTCLNLLIVFFVTGLWHGAGWNFIIWGMIHGCFVVAERIFRDRPDYRPSENIAVKALSHVYCLVVVLIAWVFFRADTPAEAVAYLGSMFIPKAVSAAGSSFRQIFGMKQIVLSVAGILAAGALPSRLLTKVKESNVFKGIILPLILFASIMLLAAGVYNPFIYFRF